MYVDDTDLLYTVKSPTATDEELIEQVQHSTTDWAVLGQAMGECLKPEKCRVYFQTYKFVRGKAQMKRLEELPTPIDHVVMDDKGTLTPTHIRIPQLDGSATQIPTLDIAELAKGLRVYFNVVGDGTDHLSNIWEKCMTWIVDKLGKKPLHT